MTIIGVERTVPLTYVNSLVLKTSQCGFASSTHFAFPETKEPPGCPGHHCILSSGRTFFHLFKKIFVAVFFFFF